MNPQSPKPFSEAGTLARGLYLQLCIVSGRVSAIKELADTDRAS